MRKGILLAFVLAHLRSTMVQGAIYSLPRLALEGPATKGVLTPIAGALGVGFGQGDQAGLGEAEALDLSIDFDNPLADNAAYSVSLPAGRTVFLEVVHTSPSRQRLLNASAVAGRFSASDVIVRFYDVITGKRRWEQGGGMVLLHAQPRSLACLDLQRLSRAALVSGIRCWTKCQSFEYVLPVESSCEDVVKELILCTG